MHTITEVSSLTGLTAYTLRYYEKLELLPPPGRGSRGRRGYTQREVEFIRFVVSLKNTGMPLEDMVEFVRDGCVMDRVNEGEPIAEELLARREAILAAHLDNMRRKAEELRQIMRLTEDKIEVYRQLRSGRHKEAERREG